MRSLIILILFFANLTVFSQDRSQWRGNSSYSNFQMQNWSVKGKITDSEFNQGLSFATISIFTVDSILVSGGISDENGKFKIEIDPRKMMEKIRENRVVNQSSGRIGMALSAEIKYLGYETLKVRLPFTQENREIDLKNISLTPDATNLNEVTVRAERSSLELKLDKRVFNVGKDLSNKGGTAEEILENIPSIDLDIEGNISLRGSQSVRILIDGKPASMMGLVIAGTLWCTTYISWPNPVVSEVASVFIPSTIGIICYITFMNIMKVPELAQLFQLIKPSVKHKTTKNEN